MTLAYARTVLADAGRLPPDLAAALDGRVQRDGEHLAERDNFQVDNNHGMTEAAALALVGVRFPQLPDAARWKALGAARIEETALATVDADGVQIENSPFYHFYQLRFMDEVARWARRVGLVLTPGFTERVERMAEFATWITQPDGQVPLMGASVELDVRRFAPEVLGPLAERHPDFDHARSGGERGTPPAGGARLFADSGLAVLRPRFSPAPGFAADTHVVFDAGPWRTNHSQFDALNVIAYAGGQTLVPDSGLYEYDDNQHGTYFDRTAAHNTVVVDDENQIGPGGSVRFGLTASGSTPAGRWAYQSGRHNLYAGVSHRRGVWVAESGVLVVVDHLRADRPRRFAQTWHTAPGTTATVDGTTVAVHDQAGDLRVRYDTALAADVATGHGDDGAVASWHSANYGERTATDGFAYVRSGRQAWFVTAVRLGPAARSVTVTADDRGGDDVDVLLCTGGRGRRLSWRRLAAGPEGGESLDTVEVPCVPGT
jgi:hypothetical protein